MKRNSYALLKLKEKRSMDSRINVLIAKMTNELAKLARLKKDHDEDFGSGIVGEPSKTEKAAIGYNQHA